MCYGITLADGRRCQRENRFGHPDTVGECLGIMGECLADAELEDIEELNYYMPKSAPREDLYYYDKYGVTI